MKNGSFNQLRDSEFLFLGSFCNFSCMKNSNQNVAIALFRLLIWQNWYHVKKNQSCRKILSFPYPCQSESIPYVYSGRHPFCKSTIYSSGPCREPNYIMTEKTQSRGQIKDCVETLVGNFVRLGRWLGANTHSHSITWDHLKGALNHSAFIKIRKKYSVWKSKQSFF